jgi:DNA-3-methyladenine glycosylase II
VVERILADLPRAVRRWARTDPVLAAMARRDPPRANWGRRQSAFASLVGSLVHQQVSLAAGRAILARLSTACDGRITPKRVLDLGPRRLRSCGLSRQKRRYVLDLARHVDAGTLDLRRLRRLPDADIVDALTQVNGIGPWTAKMFLLFDLQRKDVLAPDDLGLQIAASRAYGIPTSKARTFLEGRRAAWSPFASLASLTLWHARSLHNTP